MTTKEIVKSNQSVKSIIAAVKQGNNYATTLEGSLGVVTKYWNKGYNKAASLILEVYGLDVTTPTKLRQYMVGAKTKGLHPSMYTKIDKKGKKWITIAVWKDKVLVDESITVKDANGKDTHPWILGKDGKKQYEAVQKAVTRWSPELIFDVLIQSLNAFAMDAAKAKEPIEQPKAEEPKRGKGSIKGARKGKKVSVAA